MLIDDVTLGGLIKGQGLITDADVKQIEPCAYRLRVGSVFQPKTGIHLEKPASVDGRGAPKCFFIGPGQCLVVKTRETVKMPTDLCGYYHPLNSLAQRGIMLINASLVEPCYEGALSCFLVNFSQEEVEVHPDMDIAKISFHQLKQGTSQTTPVVIDNAKYEINLSNSARRFNESFLGIDQVADKAVEKATEATRKSVIFGGIAIALLLLFAQLEPLVSKWLWEGHGFATASARLDAVRQSREIDLARLQEQAAADRLTDRTEMNKVREELAALKQTLKDQPKSRAAR